MLLQMLRRLAAEPALAALSSGEAVLQLLMEVAKKTQLTELEVTVWALHLASVKLTERKWPLSAVLLVSAYYIKEDLGADTKLLRAVLERQSSDFSTRLEAWKQLHSHKEFSLQQIQVKWRQLKRPVTEADLEVINYNDCVDELLQTGTAPVDSFCGGEQRQTVWRPDEMRVVKTTPTPLAAYETAEEFPLTWLESMPLSPGLLFFNFTPPPSAMLRTEDFFRSP